MRKLLLLLILPSILFAQMEGKLGSMLTIKQAEAVKQPAGMVYRVSKATEYTQTLQDSAHFYRGEYDKGTFQTIISAGAPLCYEDSGKMKKIDLSEKQAKSKGYQKGYQVARSFVELDSLGGMRYEKDGLSFEVKPLFKGIKAVFEPQPSQMKATYHLEESDSDSLAWALTDPHGLAARKIPPFTAVDEAGQPVALIETRTATSLSVRIKGGKYITWPVAIDPTIIDSIAKPTSVAIARYGAATWLESRNSTTGNEVHTLPTFGARTVGALSSDKETKRAFLAFPLNLLDVATSVDSARLYIHTDGAAPYGDSCIVSVIKGTFAGGAYDVAWFNDFVGWSASGVYSITPLDSTRLKFYIADTEGWKSVLLTKNGCDSVKTYMGVDTLRLVLLCRQDIAGSASYREDVQGYKSPYLSIFYNSEPATGWSKKVSGIVPSKINGIVPSKVLGIQ